MSSSSSSLPLDHLLRPLTQLTSLTSSSATTSSYIEDWIESTQAAKHPLSQSLKKRNRSVSPVSASTSIHQRRAKRRRKSLGDCDCDVTASIMSNPLTTPGRALAAASGPITPSASYPSLPSTPTNLSKVVKNASWIGNRMDANDIIQDGECDIEGHTDIKTIINNIVDDPRGSAMKPESVKRLTQAIHSYKNANEDTILNELLPLISKRGYMKRVNPTIGEEEHDTEAGEDQYVLEDWFTAGVATASNCDFLDAHMPFKQDGGQLHRDLIRMLKKDDKMTTPRPDRCMGVRTDKFAPHPSGMSLDPIIMQALRICPTMDHPYFIVEGKSNRGHLGDAENQARRGGAVLVNASRALRAMAGEPYVEGADSTNIAFSVVMDTNVVNLYIHWAEVQKERIIYHMTCFFGTGLRAHRGFPGLRQAFNNIKEWGAVDRMPELVKLREKLYQVSIQRLNQRNEEMKEKKKNKKRKIESASSP